MLNRSLFHHRQFTTTRLITVCALLLIAVPAMFKASALRSHASSKRQTLIPNLTFEDRIAAQRALEAVYRRHRIWPKDNPQPKPSLDEMMPEAALRAKVGEYLRMSRALELFAQRPLAPGLFAANANGQGVAAAVALRVRGNVQTFEPVAQFDAATGRFTPLPIDLGPEGDQVFLIPYGTGLRFRSSLTATTIKIGGVDVPVLFAAAAPGFVGLDQVNLGPLPRSLAGRGEVDVALTVDGKTANTVRVSFK